MSIDGCPKRLLTGEIAGLLEDFGMYVRLETLPESGGLRQQDAKTVQAFAILCDERNAIEAAQMSERAKGGKDGRRSGK